MADPTYALQVAIAAALLADSGVTALVGTAVVDPLSAPNAAYPFVEIGDDEVIDETNTYSSLVEVHSTIHVWADGPSGRLLAKQISNEIGRVLASPITLDGHLMVSAKPHTARHMLDGDMTNQGQIAHSILVFQFRTVPAN